MAFLQANFTTFSREAVSQHAMLNFYEYVQLWLQGASAKAWGYIKTLGEHSQHLESATSLLILLQQLPIDQCKVKNGNILKWIIYEF